MNTPGLSLFQGAESIKLDTSLDRQEEEEELEDARRRQEELRNILGNAFDDLEEDETTVDSTTNFQSDILDNDPRHQHHQREQQQQQQQQQQYQHHNGYSAAQAHHDQLPDHSACEKQIHRLQMQLESRTRELQHSQKVLSEDHKKIDELQKRLLIAEAELNRALMEKKNTHELLVDSKEKCSNLENTIGKMNAKKQKLEEENNNLLGQLETVQTLLADAQQKYDMVERDVSKNNDRNFELKRKQMEERHRVDMELLQEQLNQVANNLDKRSAELKNMNTRYTALQQSHENMLCDKAGKINDLSQALDEAQRKRDELTSRPDYYHENVRLQKLNARLQEQIQGQEQMIKSLSERLQITSDELDVMDSVLHQHNMEDTPRRLSQTQGRVVGSTPLNPIERAGNLKDELYRALANVKSKRDELRKLQQQMEEKQAEIRQLKSEENNNLVQISTLKEATIRLENRLKVLEEENDALKSTRQANYKDQNFSDEQQDNHLMNIKQELQALQNKYDNLNELKMQLENDVTQQNAERKMLDSQLKNLEIDLEELKQEHDSLKLNYEQILKENKLLKQTTDSAEADIKIELEKNKFLLKDSQRECDRLKNLYVEISNAKEALSFEVEQLMKSDQSVELQQQKDKVANLHRALQLAEVKSAELSKILETEKLSHEREISSLRDKLEKLKMESSKVAKEAANECAKCMDYVAKLTKLEIQNLKLTNVNDMCKKEIDELGQELKTSKEHITELNDQLKLSGQQEHIIKELKTKASQFEEYIKTHTSASEMSTTSNSSGVKCSTRQLSDKSVITSPELDKNEIKNIEARIRNEMAKIFALELKKFHTRLQQNQEQSLALQREYQHLQYELQQRQTEVELLKQAILAEREQMQEILKQRDEDFKLEEDKQNVVLQKCRNELQMQSKKITDLSKELNERQSQIEAERQSMKAVMKQWEQQRKSLDAIESEWKQKYLDLQKIYDSSQQSWQTKYNSAKRTAANYKRYSEDKEAHMLKEYDRLKFEYDAALAQLELRMKEAYEKKSKELRQTLEKQRVLTVSNAADSKNKENSSNNSKS